VLFLIPWGDHWLVGTTDTDWSLEQGPPTAAEADVEYLLDHANRVLDVALTRDDVEAVYAGLRPLLAGTAESTSSLSREHEVVTPVPGLVVVAGGKYTTYRVMAADAVDAAVRDLPGTVPDSCTRTVRLLGADGYRAAWNLRERAARDAGLPVDRIERLLGRYGTLTDELLELVAREPDLGRPVDGAPDYLAVEARYAVVAEGALGLDDVLARRTRIAIETRDRGRAACADVARIVAPALGWDEARTSYEVGRYLDDRAVTVA
jgi:glycerol-3-phosphate dehydrogenase